MNFQYQLLVICLIIFGSDAYRILAVFPISSRSHNNMDEGIAKGLAKRGHQVDVVSYFKMKNPPKNYKTIINLGGGKKSLVNTVSIELSNQFDSDIIKLLSTTFGNDLCQILSLEEMQKLIKNPPNDPPYDILIIETFSANCFIGLGYVLKLPVITISPLLELPWVNDIIGNPDSTAFAPNVVTYKAEISTFWDRLYNTIVIHQGKYQFYEYTGNIQTEIMRKYLSPNIPHIREIERNVALTFVNTYHSQHGIRIRSPAMIEVGGIHIEDNDSEMSHDLQKWMDERKDGVVLFTLGSMVLIETLPKETLLSIYASFAKLAPIRVLMKIADKGKLPPGLPKNVLTSSWIPQIAVLKHKNTRLFMTHGGLMSMQEAIYYGVPLIGIPLFVDQMTNIKYVVKKNMSLLLDHRKITEKSLDEALNAVLNNPLYKESAKHESWLFRDRPMNATDTVNFWVEYIVRNGPNVLRSPAVDLYWWQNALLDVYGFILLCFVIIVYLIMFIVKYAFHRFLKTLGHGAQVKKKKEKKN